MAPGRLSRQREFNLVTSSWLCICLHDNSRKCNKDTFNTDQWWVIYKANKDLGILDLTFATPQDSLWKVNSFFLVIPEQAFYCPSFLLDLQHLRMETLETSDGPSARNAASEAWDHLPGKKKTQWNLFTFKTCYPEMWKLISNQFSRQQPHHNFWLMLLSFLPRVLCLWTLCHHKYAEEQEFHDNYTTYNV